MIQIQKYFKCEMKDLTKRVNANKQKLRKDGNVVTTFLGS